MRVLVCQVDTRSPQFTPPPRYWQNMGSTHAEITQSFRREYDAHKHPHQWQHFQVTPIMNALQCKSKEGYEYSHVIFNQRDLGGRHPSWCKCYWLLENSHDLGEKYDWVLILDTDAWIRDIEGLHACLTESKTPLLLSGEPVCRETSIHHADRVNGGFLALKPNDIRVFDFLEDIWNYGQPRYHKEWPWEQVALNATALQEKYTGLYTILPTEAVNTPAGALVSHCWFKKEAPALVVSDMLFYLSRTILPTPCRKSIEIVVARYKEDISWVYGYLPLVDKVTIYDKCDSHDTDIMYPSHPKLSVTKLPNVGREAHTYAHHLHDQYESMCDIVIFTQGNYREHIDKISFESMFDGESPKPRVGLDATWGSSIMRAFKWTPEANYTPRPMQPAEMSLGKFYLTYVGNDLKPESEIQWWQSAIFCVTRQQIHRHEPSVYEKLVHVLGHGDNTEYAHYMERFWRSLFDDTDK